MYCTKRVSNENGHLPSCFQFSYDVIQAPQTTEASFQKSLEITEYYLLVLQHGGTAKRKKKGSCKQKCTPGICDKTRSVADSKISIINSDLCRKNVSLVVFVIYTLKKYPAELSTTLISNSGKPIVMGYLAQGKFVANMETKCRAPISCN